MRLGLLAMSGVRVIDPELAWLGVTLPQFVARGHVVASLPSLSLLTLAALTPEDVEVEYVEIPHIADLNTRRLPDFDAVAISSYSAQIGEAYTLADQLRARGTKVILGGPHVTALPQEALEHADAVVLGEAEPLWPRVIEDLGRGRLERIYRAAAGPLYDLRQSPVPRFGLLDPENYNRIPIQTSRGCPHCCEFCAGSRLFGPGYRQKTVDQVLGEIRAVGEIWERPFLEFADDNLFVDRRWGRELLERLRPLGGPLVRRDRHLHCRRPGSGASPAPGRLLPASHRAGEPLARQPRGDRVHRLEGRAGWTATSMPSARSRTPG